MSKATATTPSSELRADQLRAGTYNNTAVCVYDGHPATTARTGKTGNRYGLCTDCDHADEQVTYQQAAVFVTNRLEAQAVTTADPAATLGNILDVLPEVMPEVLQKMGTADDLAEALLPKVADRVRAIRDLYQARATADAGYAEVLGIMLAAIRGGADPGDVGERVLELLAQARTEKAEARA